MSLVLVTGATGFVGHHVVDALKARGADVRALVRKTSDTRTLVERGVDLVVGDVMTGEGLKDAVKDVAAVIHVAGGGKVKRMQDMQAQNTASTAHVLGALNSARSDARLVLTSSMAAMGPAIDKRPVRPLDKARPVSAYGRSKRAAEKLVLAQAHRRHVSIVRPPGVYGPKDTRFIALFSAINKGVAPVPPGRSTSVVFGPDCADALVRCAFAEIESGQAFHVEDGHVYTWKEIARHIANAMEKRPIVFRIPSKALLIAGVASEIRGRVLDEAVVLTRDKWRDGKQRDWITTAEQTREVLGWKPSVHFADGARITAEWYAEHGWL